MQQLNDKKYKYNSSVVVLVCLQTGVPEFLSIMQKACRGYPEYLSKKGQPS